jgi:hypothetical protein
MYLRRLVVVMLIGVGALAARAQILQGQVDSVGFQASLGPVLRTGQWCPILVSLRCQGSQVFSGELRVEAIDLDGDRVAFTQPQVTVASEAGPPKRFWCYVVVDASNELPANVEVVDQDGGLVAQLPLPPQPVAPLLSDDLLVLDISYPQVTALNGLLTTGWAPGQPTDGTRRFYRNVAVARMPAADLPDRWWGLEAVDVLVWDQPDPAALSLAQRDALMEWVRNGGQLVLGIGAKWSALHKSDLAPLLPLQGDGPTVEVTRLPTFFDRVALPAWRDREFRAPVAVTTAEPVEGAFRTLGDFGPTGAISLITMRLVGSGRVVATAASLADLTTGISIDQEKFFRALFDLNAYTKEFMEKQLEAGRYSGMLTRDWLYDGLTDPVRFAGATALGGLGVFLFVAAYVVVATLASWAWLRGRGLTHLSWTVFAGFAVAASALSLGTVSALRGFSGGVRSVSILDLEAGSTEARGPCLFGYRSPTRQRVELALGEQGQFLRPLARNPQGAARYFTPARYAALPTRATLQNVLMRATLKQFAGYWSGTLDGTIRGDLRISRETGRLTPGSWLHNDLPVDLAGGYLLFIDPRQDDAGVPWRAAGLTTLYTLPDSVEVKPDPNEVPPAVNILAVQVPRIPAGEQISSLGKAQYDLADQRRGAWGGVERKRTDLLIEDRDLRTLWHEHQGWVPGGPLRHAQTALESVLLASTRNYFLGNRDTDRYTVGTPISADGLPNLDLTHWLMGGRTEGRAVLICWADAPGPARLRRDGKPLESLGALSIYRVRIPIYYEGRPPARGSIP